MKLIAGFLLLLFFIGGCALKGKPVATDWRNVNYKQRAADWRNGAVVYQIFPDRFAPSENLDSKKNLYSSPRKLRTWDELPHRGTLNEAAGLWGHELDFWGGDLNSAQGKLDYLNELGVDVIYLNPIFQAHSNHKYDTQDYFKIDPGYGTESDLKNLVAAVHDKKMHIMLDGVFNHMGRTSWRFQDALHNPKSRNRNFFVFTDKNSLG